MKKELMVLITLAAVWCAGFTAAPLLAGTPAGDAVTGAYSTVCHQFDDRSFTLAGAPLAVCIRCSSIYYAFLATLLFVLTVPALRSRQWHPLRLLALTGTPMLLDGLASLTGLSASGTFSRVFTGALFGSGMALLLHDVLCASLRTIIFQRTTTYGTTT